MSISSEISRIQQNVSDSLDAVADKGVAVPAGSGSDDLPGLIARIGGGQVDAIEMNGDTYTPVNGVVDLGTVVTDVSGKADAADVTGTATGTVTKASRVTTGTLSDATCRRVGKTVWASGRIYSMTGTAANGAFFSIPSGFRPAAAAKVNGYIVVDNVFIPCMVTVGTSGDVSFAYSSSKQATQVYFSAAWSVV